MTYHSSEARARTHDPKTSWEAADKVNTNRLEKIVLDCIKAHGNNGAIHDDVWNTLPQLSGKGGRSLNVREGSITPRYAQLEKKGLIYRDGTTRKGEMGRSQLVMYFKEKTS
tara:strand:- start:101 stop:436 length:336 start_codon:yes stop_codon:yes gene_type:complete